MVLCSVLRGFSLGTPVFPSHQKTTFDLICCDSVWFLVSSISKATVLGKDPLTSAPLKSWLFQASVRNCLNCIQNCDDDGLLDFFQLLTNFVIDTNLLVSGLCGVQFRSDRACNFTSLTWLLPELYSTQSYYHNLFYRLQYTWCEYKQFTYLNWNKFSVYDPPIFQRCILRIICWKSV